MNDFPCHGNEEKDRKRVAASGYRLTYWREVRDQHIDKIGIDNHIVFCTCSSSFPILTSMILHQV